MEYNDYDAADTGSGNNSKGAGECTGELIINDVTLFVSFHFTFNVDYEDGGHAKPSNVKMFSVIKNTEGFKDDIDLINLGSEVWAGDEDIIESDLEEYLNKGGE